MTATTESPVDGTDALRLPERGVVEVVGPDGVGKSTLVDALLAGPLADRPVLRLHHRPGVLPTRGGASGDSTQPHTQTCYPAPLSWLKVVYLWLDHVAGGVLRTRPAARRGWVVLERGWWDIAVDPQRYRLQLSRTMTRALGRATPYPQLVLVLEAPAEEVVRRKDELTLLEVQEQTEAWRTLPASVRRVHLDATVSRSELRDAAAAELGRLDGLPRRDHGWVGLPTRGAPRWILPRGPRRVARASLRVHQPMTPAGLAGWFAARAAASLGLFRLLPRHDGPPQDLLDQLRHLSVRAPFVAVARVRGHGRYVALLLDADGGTRAVVKLASDRRAQDDLDREESSLRRVGTRLEPPLSAPRVLDRARGALVLEAAEWSPRLRPWRLPPRQAAAIGACSRDGAAPGSGGAVAHGDFAPWNVLSDGSRWTVVDWEDAGPRPPWYDLWHYLVQSHVLLGRPSTRALLRGVRGRGWVGSAVSAYAGAAGLPRSEAAVALSSYLLSALEGAGPPYARGSAEERRRRLLHRLQRAMAAEQTSGPQAPARRQECT